MQLETKFLRLRTPVVIHLFAVRNWRGHDILPRCRPRCSRRYGMNSLEVAILSESSSLKLAGAARRLTSPLWMRCFLRCFWVINSRVVKCARCGKEEADGAGRCPHCDARPLAVGPPVWPRALGALAAGSLIYLCTLYRGLAYDQRGHDCRPPPDNTYIVGGRVVLRPCDPGLPFEFFIFSGLMLAAGFALALRIPRLRYTVASLILAGVFAGQWYVLTMDWQIDPTGHNLLPFEVILLAIFAAPAYLGAAVAHAVDASTKQQGEALSPGAEPSEP